MTFQIHALPETPYQGLFDLSDADLAARNMLRVTADASPGYPCRVSLRDADIGDELILLNHRHLDGNTPYSASHAIYVRKNVTQAYAEPGAVPDVLARRLLSVRAFDARKLMVHADVIDGPDLAATLASLFTDPEIEFIQIHYARQGCFAAHATRA
jgi:hypothetical protein